uniref:Frizzled-4 n=1 Tax=Caenorhabditis japonica TaxID=281687 RepID=A0A8R1HNN8_CAEJA
MLPSVKFLLLFFLHSGYGFNLKKPKCEPITIPLCKGIGYNMTAFPNSYGHEKQEEAGLEVHQFYPLVEVGCFQHLKFFLCTMYTPICQDNYDKPILPCMELCLEARNKCSPIMAKYGFRWPETLSCDELPKMADQLTTGNICAAPPDTPPKKQKGHHQKPQPEVNNNRPQVGISKIETDVIVPSDQCECTCNQPFQFVESEKAKVGNVSNCAYSCHSPALADNQSLVSNWMAFWSITCCVLAAFTFLTFLIETDRFQYPERPIFMLAFCQFMVAIGFMIRYFVGHEEIACDSMRIKGADDNSGSLCFVVFLLTYFFGMAASVWWVILSLTWVLSAASKWSTEAIASFSFHFHVVGWCLPAAQTVLVIFFNAIDGDPITGICYVGNTDIQFQRIFVLAPLLVFFLVGVFFLIIGFFNLWSIRNEVQKQHPSLESAHKITQLMSKIGIFSLLYTIPSLLIISVLFYEQNHRPVWEQNHLCSCSSSQSTVGDSSLVISLIKTCCMCVLGWTSGFWVCSTKTLSSWKNAICCLGSSHSLPKYQPADILYAKSDMSSPQFYNTSLRHNHIYGGIPDKL